MAQAPPPAPVATPAPAAKPATPPPPPQQAAPAGPSASQLAQARAAITDARRMAARGDFTGAELALQGADRAAPGLAETAAARREIADLASARGDGRRDRADRRQDAARIATLVETARAAIARRDYNAADPRARRSRAYRCPRSRSGESAQRAPGSGCTSRPARRPELTFSLSQEKAHPMYRVGQSTSLAGGRTPSARNCLARIDGRRGRGGRVGVDDSGRRRRDHGGGSRGRLHDPLLADHAGRDEEGTGDAG